MRIDSNFMLISEKHFIWKIRKTTNKNKSNNLVNNYNFVAMLLIAKYFITSFFIYIFHGFFHLSTCRESFGDAKFSKGMEKFSQLEDMH